MNIYFERITATAISGATSTGWARETEAAAPTPTPTDTPTPYPSLTPSALPSKTPGPLSPTPNLPAAVEPGNGMPPGIILVVEALIFAIVGFIVYRRLLRKP